jgi:hypothetical protein
MLLQALGVPCPEMDYAMRALEEEELHILLLMKSTLLMLGLLPISESLKFLIASPSSILPLIIAVFGRVSTAVDVG